MGGVRASIHMMREGIKPAWEAPANQAGGIWNIRVHKKQTEEAWRSLLLTAIGGNFETDDDDDINGVTVSIRKFDNIVQVWTRNAKADTDRVFKCIEAALRGVTLKNPFYKPN